MGKKIFAVLLILTIAFSMAACGKKKKVMINPRSQAASRLSNRSAMERGS